MKSRLRLRVLLPTAVLALAGVGVSAFAFGGTPPLAGDDPLPAPLPKAAANAANKKTSPAPAASKKAWAKQASALCRAALKEADSVPEPQSPEELQAYLAATAQRASKLLAGLEALPRPAAERRAIAALLANARKATKLFEEGQQALAAKDSDAFASAMDESEALDRKFDAAAVRLGAGDCAVDSTKPLTPLEKALVKDRIVVVVLYSSDSAIDRLAIREARAGANAARVGFLAVEVANTKDVSSFARQYSVRKAPAVLVMRRWLGAVTTFPSYVDRETVAQAAVTAKV